MSDRMRTSALAAALALALLPAIVAHDASAQGSSEQELMRKIKEDVFDERWAEVLESARELIEGYPGSSSMARTMIYRARALEKLGRDDEAMEAYGQFVEKFPGEILLREDALISQMGLAKRMVLSGRKEAVEILVDGLREKGYPKIYAAIQLSFLDFRPGHSKALPILKECAEGEQDAEVRNECTLAILRIDPTALEYRTNRMAPGPSSDEGPAPAPGGEPKLIRLQVRDKVTDKITVAVNLPVAFAEALLGSLSELEQGRVVDELKARGYDINNLWKSLKTLGKQTLVEIETEEARIKVWLE